MNLTPRQKQLLDYLITTVQDKRIPPTVAEMARALKVKSKNAIAKLLAVLEDKAFLKRDGTPRGIKIFDQFGNEVLAGSVAVPVLGTVPAGGPILVEEHVEEWINLPESFLRGRKEVFLLKVRGDSMVGAGILEKDLVIVKPTKVVKSGDIVVALLRDEATVKRFIDVNGRKYLKPENSKYQNIYPQNEWIVQGKVVGVIRQLE